MSATHLMRSTRVRLNETLPCTANGQDFDVMASAVAILRGPASNLLPVQVEKITMRNGSPGDHIWQALSPEARQGILEELRGLLLCHLAKITHERERRTVVDSMHRLFAAISGAQASPNTPITSKTCDLGGGFNGS